MELSKNGLEFIKKEEGVRLKAYKCPAGVWTIGYGHTGGVKDGDTVTQQRADDLLISDTCSFVRTVNENIVKYVALVQHEFDALVSFAFNVGSVALKESTLRSLLTRGAMRSAVADQFDKWVKGGGKVLPVLVARRAREKKLFLEGDYGLVKKK